MMALLAAIALSTLAFNADPKGDLAIASIKVSGSFFRDLGSIHWMMDFEDILELLVDTRGRSKILRLSTSTSLQVWFQRTTIHSIINALPQIWRRYLTGTPSNSSFI
jgi:hypothetical protein